MKCPDCGIEQKMDVHSPEKPDSAGFVGLTSCTFTYSCEHYQDICQHPRCAICGKRDAPVCQVPASIPFSDAYCHDPACIEAMRAKWEPIAAEWHAEMERSWKAEHPDE